METTLEIVRGSFVDVTDRHGRVHQMEALTGVEEDGHSFPVVLVRRPLDDGTFDVVPWPADSVRPHR